MLVVPSNYHNHHHDLDHQDHQYLVIKTIIHNKDLDHQDQDHQHEQQGELVAGQVGDLDFHEDNHDDPPEGNHPMARPQREARKPTTMPWH